MKLLKTFICILTLISLPAQGIAETVVTQIGIASPQNSAEEQNIEKLRERAIRIAMDLAVMQIAGTEVSSLRGSSQRTSEMIKTTDGKSKEQLQQQSRYRSGATSRTEGHARLLQINREWQDNGQYFVEAQVAVLPPDEHQKTKNCGYFWQQAGKPRITINLSEDHNGRIKENSRARTLQYLRDNLNRNGVTVAADSRDNGEYIIKVYQVLESREIAAFNTTTAHCRLSFQMIDNVRKQSVAEHVANHGPQAGFNKEQAWGECIKTIAPNVAEHLVRTIGAVMVDRLNNGVEQQIIIANIPGNSVTSAAEILQNLYRVTYATPAGFAGGTFTQTIKFKGSGSDLASSIQTAFIEEGWKTEINQVEGGEIHLQWINTHN